MNITKYAIVVGVTAAIVGGAGLVLAEGANNGVTNHPAMTLSVNPNGKTLLRGTVKTVGTNSLTVTSWGGDWTVNISGTTALPPSSSMSEFAVGDFVGAQGTMSTTSAWTVDATLVRDWTTRQQANENKQEIKGTIKAMAAHNWEGVVSNMNSGASTLTLTIEGTAHNVVLAAGAKVVSKVYATLSFSSIQNGDTVRVYGPAAADGTITASVVRDTSK